MNVLIAGGGTGGHISPGLALYDEFIKDGNNNVCLVVTKKDLNILPSFVKYFTLPLVAPMGIKGKVKFFFLFIISLFKCFGIIFKTKPDVVVGMGGYVSLPMLVAAKLFFKPVAICEQNSVPGKANRLMSFFAQRVYLTFHKSQEYIPKGIVTGNPVRKQFYNIDKDKARKMFEIDANEKVLLIMGGSQGAKRINEIFLEAYPEIRESINNLRVIWLTGSRNYEEISNKVKSAGYKEIIIYAYYKEAEYVMHAADFALARSGSSSLSEFLVTNLPALFVPFPYATDDHQYYNAKDMEDKDAAYLIREEALDKKKLVDIMNLVFNNSERLKEMCENIKSHTPINASKAVVSDMIKYFSQI